MLRRRLPHDLVRKATHAWCALSRATHHHCYETAPSAVELRRLHADTASIIATLRR